MKKSIIEDLLRLGLRTEPHLLLKKGQNSSVAGLLMGGGPIIGSKAFSGLSELRRASGTQFKARINRKTRAIKADLPNMEPYDAPLNEGSVVLTNNGNAARKMMEPGPGAYDMLENSIHGKV